MGEGGGIPMLSASAPGSLRMALPRSAEAIPECPTVIGEAASVGAPKHGADIARVSLQQGVEGSGSVRRGTGQRPAAPMGRFGTGPDGVRTLGPELHEQVSRTLRDGGRGDREAQQQADTEPSKLSIHHVGRSPGPLPRVPLRNQGRVRCWPGFRRPGSAAARAPAESGSGPGAVPESRCRCPKAGACGSPRTGPWWRGRSASLPGPAFRCRPSAA